LSKICEIGTPLGQTVPFSEVSISQGVHWSLKKNSELYSVRILCFDRFYCGTFTKKKQQHKEQKNNNKTIMINIWVLHKGQLGFVSNRKISVCVFTIDHLLWQFIISYYKEMHHRHYFLLFFFCIYFILFYFILFYFILFYFILFYLSGGRAWTGRHPWLHLLWLLWARRETKPGQCSFEGKMAKLIIYFIL
jgi:hypothetical protein